MTGTKKTPRHTERHHLGSARLNNACVTSGASRVLPSSRWVHTFCRWAVGASVLFAALPASWTQSRALAQLTDDASTTPKDEGAAAGSASASTADAGTADAAPPDADKPSKSTDTRPRDDIGNSFDALPGFYRVGLANTASKSLSLTGGMGYGFTEAQGDDDGAHHRLAGSLSVGWRALRWLAVSLTVRGRYDMHPDDEIGKDDGWTGRPELRLRGGWALGDDFYLGGQAAVWVAGGQESSIDFASTSGELSAMATYAPRGSGLALGLTAGYRIDRTAAGVTNPGTLRQGDRIALGASDFDAFVLGLGGGYRVGAWEPFGEFHWSMLVGSNAPSLSVSPMHLAAGVRYHAGESLQIQAVLDTAINGRPGIGPDDALVPIEPRVALLLGLTYRFGFESWNEGKSERPVERVADEEEDEATTAQPTAPSMLVEVRDAEGNVIEGAELFSGDEGDTEALARSDANGVATLQGLPPGKATFVVRAEGFRDGEATATVREGSTAKTGVVLSAKPVPGQLRGLIRSFSGRGVAAEISVSPGDVRVTTDADGRFEVELEPGEYRVSIEADGFRGQTRKVQLEVNGVTILNADLREGGPKRKRRR